MAFYFISQDYRKARITRSGEFPTWEEAKAAAEAFVDEAINDLVPNFGGKIDAILDREVKAKRGEYQSGIFRDGGSNRFAAIMSTTIYND